MFRTPKSHSSSLHRVWTGACALLSLPLLALALACVEPTPAPVGPDSGAAAVEVGPEVPEFSASAIYDAVAFLADDAQEGRAPGSEADARVQAWIAERMAAAGLEPGGVDGFAAPFLVGDGVRLREGEASHLVSRGAEIPHSLLPFGHDSGAAPVAGKLVYVGFGVPGAPAGTPGADGGDYAGIASKHLEGAIVVAMVGASDPHGSGARPQSKLIAARDHKAAGFILWDPNSDLPPPNHGAFSELEIPALFVGKSGTEALRKALRVRGEDEPKLGSRSRASFELATPIDALTLPTANMIGVLPGSAPEGERLRIYLGAHMDHLGMGTSSSLAPGEHAVHNGADDNASGVAVLLALAEGLGKLSPEHRPHDLVFVAFGAEEMGLLGSKALVEGLSDVDRGQILTMLNFDMVGRLDGDLVLDGRGTAEELELLVEAANADLGMGLAGQPGGWGPSDHASFYGEGVPVLHFFTGAHADYHKPSDDLDKLNPEGAAQIAGLAARVVLGLMDVGAPLTYVEVARPKVGRSRFRVSLGTMPDYGRDVDGMGLADVREGGPTHAAGLRKGDVIKRIGAREIHNIDDYMASFGELEPGVEVEVEFERDGALETTVMTPAAPQPH